MTKKALSDKAKSLLACMVAGNDGEEVVKTPRPNPDEGIYSVLPSDWDHNEAVGVINATFTVTSKGSDASAPECGRTMFVTFWINTPAAVQRSAGSLHLALTGKFLNGQPSCGTVLEWFLDLMAAPEWIVRRSVREGNNGKLFCNDAFFTVERWRQVEKDSNAVTSPAEIAAAVG
jgi:hypothetical protein